MKFKPLVISLVVMVLAIVLSGIASAVPPVTQVQYNIPDPFLTIKTPAVTQFDGRTTVKLNFHVFNSTGVWLQNNSQVTCNFHLYDARGEHIDNKNLLISNESSKYGDFEYEFPTANFTIKREYSYIIYCNSSTEYGFVSENFYIGKDADIDPIIPTDSTNGLAVVIFILVIAGGLFVLPLVTNFSNNKFVDLILKRSSIIIGTYLMLLNTAIVASIADAGNLPVLKELFQYMWMIGIVGYVFMGWVALMTLIDVVKMWNFTKKQKRMGEDEE